MSERLRSVVEQLDIRLDDRVLEIGCGHGVAATLVCQRLETGHLTAIDRSEKMIRAAARRNAAFVETGRAEFLVADLEDFDPGERRFDKIFAVRVGLFHREPERARGMVERWLAPGGTVSVFFDQPANGRKGNPRNDRSCSSTVAVREHTILKNLSEEETAKPVSRAAWFTSTAAPGREETDDQ